LLTTVSHFKDLTATRTASQLEAARMSSDRWSLVAKIMLSLTATVFLAVLYFILRRRVAMPLMRMTGIVGRLAKQDYSVDVPADLRRDEIGEMNSAIEVFRANGLERERLDAERQADQRTKDLILQMLHRLQACQKPEELPDVVARFAPQVFPDAAGALYVLDGSKTTLMRASKWLEPKHTALSFLASACWGMRRGRFHVSGTASGDVPCEHLHEPTVTALCVPLTAQGDMIGLLYLEELEGRAIELGRVQLYLELIAENLGLAIANLQMREKLTLLAIKDPLTGLYNRRFLDEALARFAADATVLSSMTCMMIDIDHFKRFNDQFGHDAGDMVMRSVAELLEQGVGAAGTVYRFGGEEFTILLPDGGEDRGLGLADMLRLSVQRLALSHSGKALGSVTISIGIASSAGSAATLIAHADASLLKAKTGGRNRVVVASNTGRFNIT
jgi:diguanylate cyclase (GGDEF)-like protein